MSPGTSSVAGKDCFRPPRTATTSEGTIVVSASIALLARYSWTKPMIALRITTPPMTRPSTTLPVRIARTVEASRT